MSPFPSPPAPMEPTSIDELERMLARLSDGRGRWVDTSTTERAALLRRCLDTTVAQAERWGEVARLIKGYAPGSKGHGEEFLAGTLAVMRNLRLFAEALEAGGQPTLPKTWQRPDGQWVARVFPQSLIDKAMFTGVTCDIWIEPGEQPTQGRIYREKAQGQSGDGGISVVLGAGNQSSIPPMDVLYKLVVDDEVCILKMNPVNEALGPVFADALAPLVEAGFLEVCYGGIEVGKHLTDHDKVTSIHITGSDRAHDAIIWGPGEEGEERKKAGTPRLDKHITSELGCVSPVLVVPGPWSDKELDYQALQVASMLTYNCGFNCNGARLITVASGWEHKDRFLALVQEKLASVPARKAYYPTAQATWERFTAKYPDHEALGEVPEGALPWTILKGVTPQEGEYALGNEPWCGIFSFVELEATTPSEFLAAAVPYANDLCWGTLTINVLIHPKTETTVSDQFDQAIADLRYGGIAINCWSGLNYALVNATWGAFPGHPLDDVESGQGVVHNGLLVDHPQKSVVRAPFITSPKPVWFADHTTNLELGRRLVKFERSPSWLSLPGIAVTGFRG